MTGGPYRETPKPEPLHRETFRTRGPGSIALLAAVTILAVGFLYVGWSRGAVVGWLVAAVLSAVWLVSAARLIWPAHSEVVLLPQELCWDVRPNHREVAAVAMDDVAKIVTTRVTVGDGQDARVEVLRRDGSIIQLPAWLGERPGPRERLLDAIEREWTEVQVER